MPCFYLTPKQDDSNQELQICIAEALYDVDSIAADPGAYTKEELTTLHSQIVSNLEQAWEIAGGSEDQLTVRCFRFRRRWRGSLHLLAFGHEGFIGDLDRLGDDLVPVGVQPGQFVSARRLYHFCGQSIVVGHRSLP